MSGAIPVAVASNGRAEDVRGLLERAGMLHLFDVIVTIDDVEHGKPDPAPYLLAAQRLGLAASAVAAFEDSPSGPKPPQTLAALWSASTMIQTSSWPGRCV